jgi:hypothetical protein
MKKFLQWMTLIIFVLATPAVHRAEHQSPPTASQATTDRTLQRQYDADNERYFGNSLPRVSVKWADIPLMKNGDRVMGETAEDFTHHAQYIRVDRATNVTWGTVLLTIRHEECHVSEDPLLPLGLSEDEEDNASHGEAFQNCMIHLADIGAFREAW